MSTNITCNTFKCRSISNSIPLKNIKYYKNSINKYMVCIYVNKHITCSTFKFRSISNSIPLQILQKLHQYYPNCFTWRQRIHTDNNIWLVLNEQLQEIHSVLWWRMMCHYKGVDLTVGLWKNIILGWLHRLQFKLPNSLFTFQESLFYFVFY